MLGPAGTLMGLGGGNTQKGYTPEGEQYEYNEGRDYYRGGPMVNYPGERENLLGYPISPKLKRVLLGVMPYGRLLSEIDRLNPGDVFGSEDERAMRPHPVETSDFPYIDLCLLYTSPSPRDRS